MSSEAKSPSPEAQPVAQPSHILPAEHWTEQAIDDDNDSSLGDDAASSTASLSTSILQYRTLHGRTYHSDRVTDAQYWTPNDQRQMEAADVSHHCLTLIHEGRLFHAPLKDDIERVLDVGTGTGIWAIDFADLYPNTTVIGTDISPIQPTWVPPNLKFEIDDATLDWTYPDNHFDYIHMRYLVGSITDWPALFRQAYRCCKPGGYVESYEASCSFESDDGTLVEGSPMDQWGKVFIEAGKKFGRSFDIVNEGVIPDSFRKAGFEEITEWEFKCPIGSWPQDEKLKEIGQYGLLSIDLDIEGWILYTWSQVMGWTKEQISVYIAHFRRQLRDPKVHSYFRMRAVYARKPERDQPAPASAE